MHPVRVTLAGLILAILSGLVGGVQAQSEGDVWGAPVNLSRSGAAEQPRVVASLDGRLQVFWWDRFDGLVTADFNGTAWSLPRLAPILMTVEVENPGPGEEDTLIVRAASETPVIVSDETDWVHALWLGEPDEETGVRELLHSQMPFGSNSWSEPQAVAESAVGFDVIPTPSGGLTLAYVRTLHTDESPAGLYVRRKPGRGGIWRTPEVVHDTIYYRLLTPKDAYVRVADDGDGMIRVVWEDPRLEEAFHAYSVDGGATWKESESLGEPDQRPARPRVSTLLDGGVLRVWEALAVGGCAFYQQRLVVTDAPTESWGPPELILQRPGQCPEGDQFWPRDDKLFWLSGEGSDALILAALDPVEGGWSEPRVFYFRFEDPETGRRIDLHDLHAALAGRTLVVVGSEPSSGEVRATMAEIDLLELAFAPPPLWSEPVRFSREGTEAGWADVALDAEGGVHMAWGERKREGEPATAVLYAYRDSSAKRWSRAVEMARGAIGEELVHQPALIADERGLIQLVWSGGIDGQILYSRASADQVTSATGWSPPQALSDPEMTAAWPQFGMDGVGRLYVVYAVPLNEGRGIYVVRSEDGGISWSAPVPIFSAQPAGWAMVDHPALAVEDDGTLHLAWVSAALPDTGPPQGIYYARLDISDGVAPDATESDSDAEQPRGSPILVEPQELAGVGYDWPRLALAGGEVHLIYTDTEGNVFRRRQRMNVETEGGGWDTPQQISGLNQVSPPVGVTVDGAGTIHAVGVDAGGEALFYSAWDGEIWRDTGAFVLDPQLRAGLGAWVTTMPQGERLAALLRITVTDEEENAMPTLHYMERAIPTVEVSPSPARPMSLPQPAAIAEAAESEPTPTLTLPTPTPDLTGGVEPSNPPVDPRLLGGGVAIVILLATLVTWPIWGKRR